VRKGGECGSGSGNATVFDPTAYKVNPQTHSTRGRRGEIAGAATFHPTGKKYDYCCTFFC
jgi:hypothetical protein